MKFIILLIFIFLSLNSVSTLDKENDCRCFGFNGRIINGTDASIYDYPWIVQIAKMPDRWSNIDEMRRLFTSTQDILDLHKCTGTIINENWILTAAHCIDDNIRRFAIGNSFDDLITIFNQDTYIRIDRAIPHPQFNETGIIKADIALIRLDTPLEFNSYNAQPACFPRDSNFVDFYQGVLKISGFGYVDRPIINMATGQWRNKQQTQYLQEADVYDMTNSDWFCNQRRQENICVANGEKASCFGDSGGPLHWIDNGIPRVIGIASLGNRQPTELADEYVSCADLSVYTRLSTYMDFFTEYIGDDYCNVG